MDERGAFMECSFFGGLLRIHNYDGFNSLLVLCTFRLNSKAFFSFPFPFSHVSLFENDGNNKAKSFEHDANECV